MKERVFINNENIATFICPECQKVRNADVSNIIGIETALKIKCQCKCGKKFEAILERRKYFRKCINLVGKCYFGKEKYKYSIIVNDISRSGLKLKINDSNNLKLEDEMLVEFYLDDDDKSIVSKEVIIRSIQGADFGVEFKSPEHYDKLGSYLMFY